MNATALISVCAMIIGLVRRHLRSLLFTSRVHEAALPEPADLRQH
jgi:hypothetical protein